MNQLDHIIIAAPNLVQAVESFADTTGCKPMQGGAHAGLGTKNALLSFGGTSYLEIIAPDPAQSLDGTFGAALADFNGLQLLHWAIRSNDLGTVAARATQIGFNAGPIRDTSRIQPDGTRLAWRLMGLRGHELGGLVPFYIDWLDCPHPANTAPVVGPLIQCSVSVLEGPLHELIGTTSGVDFKTGPPNLTFSFESTKGEIEYASNSPGGFLL